MAAGELSTLSEPPQYMREAVPDGLTMNLFDDQWLPDIFVSWGP
jgi:hypothetical protein